jgi:hypothetical protein
MVGPRAPRRLRDGQYLSDGPGLGDEHMVDVDVATTVVPVGYRSVHVGRATDRAESETAECGDNPTVIKPRVLLVPGVPRVEVARRDDGTASEPVAPALNRFDHRVDLGAIRQARPHRDEADIERARHVDRADHLAADGRHFRQRDSPSAPRHYRHSPDSGISRRDEARRSVIHQTRHRGRGRMLAVFRDDRNVWPQLSESNQLPGSGSVAVPCDDPMASRLDPFSHMGPSPPRPQPAASPLE